MDASPPKICRVRATPVDVPLGRPHPTASGVVGSAPLVLVDLETDQGLTGHAYAFCYTPLALKPIADLTEALQPLIQGQAAGLPVSSHLFPELSAQLLAVSPQAHWLEYQDWATPILERPLALKDGFALPQAEAGCGLAWDPDAVERYRLR